MLRPFAIGLCIMFIPTVVLGTINSILSPVVQGTAKDVYKRQGKDGAFRHVGEFPVLDLQLGTGKLILYGFIADV